MKVRSHALTGVLVAVLLVAVNSGEAQTQSKPAQNKPAQNKPAQSKMTPAEILTTLKPGQWVQLDGIVQKDASVLCTQVKLLTGDFLDDDWELTGVVRKLDQTKQEIEILRPPIKVQKDAEFKNKAGTLKSFADLKVGMFAQAQGTYLQDGTFLAKEIQDKSEKLAAKPDVKNEVTAVGKVEKVDPAKRTVTLMGIAFQLTDDTKGRSAIK